MSDHIECAECHTTTTSVVERTYSWNYQPKAKYNEAGGMRDFKIKLCGACYQKTPADYTVTGHDWWDAFDDLSFSFLIPQDERDYWNNK